MSKSFSAAKLAAFTISLLLLTQSIQPGWGIDGSWGWYLGLVVLTGMSFFDSLSFVAFVLAWLLLLGIVAVGHAIFIALTIFTGAAVLRRLLSRSSSRGHFTWYATTHRFGPPSSY